MRRREFLALIGATAACPLAARAQPTRLPTIGFLGSGTSSAFGQWAAAFAERLRQLGWMEGRTVGVEYGWEEGRTERFREIEGEFVGLKEDVIVAGGSAVPDTAQASTERPIVFAYWCDSFE